MDKATRAALMSSASEEWYTPRWLVERLGKFWPINVADPGLYGLDLDPCSEAPAPGMPFNIPARQHFTKADNGLGQIWNGTVFMNPPYGRQVGKWITKLVAHTSTGTVPEAIALVPARVDTQWWQLLGNCPVIFLTGRLTFGGPDSTGPATFPSALVYLGGRPLEFFTVFGADGLCYVPLTPADMAIRRPAEKALMSPTGLTLRPRIGRR